MIEKAFGLNWTVIAAQLLSFLHIALACFATAFILKKRRELSSMLVMVAFLVAWLVPLLGPMSVLWGLRGSRAVQQ